MMEDVSDEIGYERGYAAGEVAELSRPPAAMDDYDDADVDGEVARQEAIELRSEQRPFNLLVFPTKRERIEKLPLFRLVARDLDCESFEDASHRPFQVRALGEAPARWLDPREAVEMKTWHKSTTVRVGLMLYVAGGQSSWARLVRKAMLSHSEDAFYRVLARLDPWPRILDEENRQGSGSGNTQKLPAASLNHIAGELERMAWEGKMAQCLPSNRSCPMIGTASPREIRRFARVLAARIRGALSNITQYGADEKKLSSEHLDFRFLLPDGSLTHLRAWFGWKPKWKQKVHPLVVDRYLAAALGKVGARDGAFDKAKTKDEFLKSILSVCVEDKQGLSGNAFKPKNGRLEKLGVRFT
jgi:hypothetical protein